jgi:hypothetical protein
MKVWDSRNNSETLVLPSHPVTVQVMSNRRLTMNKMMLTMLNIISNMRLNTRLLWTLLNMKLSITLLNIMQFTLTLSNTNNRLDPTLILMNNRVLLSKFESLLPLTVLQTLPLQQEPPMEVLPQSPTTLPTMKDKFPSF